MASNTIQLKGDIVRKERVAAGTIVPGMLLELTSANAVQAHSVANGFAQRWYALENDLIGRGIGDPATPDADKYVSGEQVQIGSFLPGAEVNAILKSGQNVARGAYLTSGGDGRLVACGSPGTNDYPVAIALEAVNASSAAKRIQVEVL